MKTTAAIILLLIFTAGCDGGLNPDDAQKNTGKAYLSGTIRYEGGKDGWPEDSVYGMRIAAFRQPPPYIRDSLIAIVLAGEAYFTLQSLPLYADSNNFMLEIPDAPVELRYITAAMQTDSSIYAQTAAGIYSESGNFEPSSLFIEAGDTANITIFVDFDNLPPQPFE